MTQLDDELDESIKTSKPEEDPERKRGRPRKNKLIDEDQTEEIDSEADEQKEVKIIQTQKALSTNEQVQWKKR